MPDLLLELFSEEIPARMQARAAEDLRRLVTDGLVAAGLTYAGAKAFATPRRLALTVHGLTARSADVREERKGPRVGAPPQAIDGFLRAAGLTSIDEAEVQRDPKKGEFYVAIATRPGRRAEEIVAQLVPEVVRGFPWPKAMRWGARSAPEGTPYSPADAEGANTLRWVRPLRSIVCTFGPETEETQVVPFEVSGIRSGNVTYGHRFMAGAAPIAVRRFEDYVEKLAAAKVVLDPERRKAIIETEAKNLAFAQGLELVEDAALLDEVAGLVEWPVVLMGSFDPAFGKLPDEVIRLTIRQNQKCFVLRDPASGRLTNRFLLTANLEASDGGAAIIAGNERVIRARLSDARFFWQQDLKLPLEQHARKLAAITFHEKLGTQAERVERIATLARVMGEVPLGIGQEPERAARLCKADLTTRMVTEFPELQGTMGRYYALAAGEPPEIADAIRDHYRPQGVSDRVPTGPVSVLVGLADKFDSIVGLWAVGESPTGSRDPFGLRRAALGIIRLFDQVGFDLPVYFPISVSVGSYHSQGKIVDYSVADGWNDIVTFLFDRLRAKFKDEGYRYDIVDAIFSVLQSGIERKKERTPEDIYPLDAYEDIVLSRIPYRLDALDKFVRSENGRLFIEAVRRVLNILKSEERKGEEKYSRVSSLDLRESDFDKERSMIYLSLDIARRSYELSQKRDFLASIMELARMTPYINEYFENTMINVGSSEIRRVRLQTLATLRATAEVFADFSKIVV